MEYIGDVFYNYGTDLYANITNKCPCSCEFCIRDIVDALGTADSLWLKREPTLEELKEMVSEIDLTSFDELIFCGYGEPTARLDVMLELVRYIKGGRKPAEKLRSTGKSHSSDDTASTQNFVSHNSHKKTEGTVKVRLNTNGLANLMYGRDTTPDMVGLIDRVSVSLNAPTAEKYNDLCHPDFGLKSWDAILDYTRLAKERIGDVTMSVVSGTISDEDIRLCRDIAEREIGVKFRVR